MPTLTPYPVLAVRILIQVTMLVGSYVGGLSAPIWLGSSVILAMNVAEVAKNKVLAGHPRWSSACQAALTAAVVAVCFMLSLLRGPTMFAMAAGQAG